MSVKRKKSLFYPTQQTAFIKLSLDSVSMQACRDCGAAKEDSVPTTVFPSWGKFDYPDMAQAAGDGNSSLSNYTPGVALFTTLAEVVQQPYLHRSDSQVHCKPPSVERQLIFAALCSS